MIPRKSKSLYPEIALEEKVSEDLIESVIDFYWKEIKNNLSKPDHITLSLDNFGVFEIRRRQVEYMINKYKGIITYMKPDTYAKQHNITRKIEELARFENLIRLDDIQRDKKQQMRLKQNSKLKTK